MLVLLVCPCYYFPSSLSSPPHFPLPFIPVQVQESSAEGALLGSVRGQIFGFLCCLCAVFLGHWYFPGAPTVAARGRSL